MPLLALSSTVPAAAGSGSQITTGITPVGTPAHTAFNGSQPVTKLNFTSLNIGDLVAVLCGGGNGSQVAVPSSMASSGATGFQAATGPTNIDPTWGGGAQIWYGTIVTPTAPDQLQVTWLNNPNATFIDIYQFTTGVETGQWVLDKSAVRANASSTTITYPPLTPALASSLYVGTQVNGAGTATVGATSGFTYVKNVQGNNNDIVCYNPNCAASAQSPTATISPAEVTESVAAVWQAFNALTLVNSQSVTLGVIPTGRMWVVSQIGYEILPVTTNTNIVATVTMNGRAVYTGANGNGGSNQGPPYITVRPGDSLTITWTNVPIGSSCIGNFFYNEYDAYAQPQDIGGLV